MTDRMLRRITTCPRLLVSLVPDCSGDMLSQTACMTFYAAGQAGVEVEPDKLPFRDKRNGDGRLFAASAADVPALLPAQELLKFPVELGSLTYPLAFTKVCATLHQYLAQ